LYPEPERKAPFSDFLECARTPRGTCLSHPYHAVSMVGSIADASHRISLPCFNLSYMGAR
jgi:hypothetical protein